MIKEFDLDAPQETHETRLKFRRETRCVTSLMERCYSPSEDTGTTWKILVEVVDRVTQCEYRDLLGVLTIQVEGNVAEFIRADKHAKMGSALKLLMKGVERVAHQMEWDISSFRSAEKQVVSREFVNEWVWKTPVPNKSKSLMAEILVEHKVDEVRISARFRDNENNVLNTQHLVSDEPNEFVFDEYFGKLTWIDDKTVELESRNGDKLFSASL